MFMKSLMCVAAAAFSFSLAACGSPDSQRAEPGLAHVRVDPTGQWVSIDANNVPAQSILLDLSEQARFALTISDASELGSVTVAAESISVEEGIRRVLGATPYTLEHAVGENGRKYVASVDVGRRSFDNAGLYQTEKMMTTAAERRTADFGWGANRGNNGDSAEDSDRVADLAATLENLSPDTVKQLMSEAKDPAVRASMLEALTERDDQNSVRPLFLDALHDADADVRGAALEHLQSSYDPIPLAPLADAVMHEVNPDLRIETMQFLSDQALTEGRTTQDVTAAIASVTQALADPNPAVREQAQWSLEELSQAAN